MHWMAFNALLGGQEGREEFSALSVGCYFCLVVSCNARSSADGIPRPQPAHLRFGRPGRRRGMS